MIVLIHVIIAISSIVIASFTFFKPSLRSLIVSYGFILGTVGTGTYLMFAFPSHILQSCLMGLFYLTVVTIATIAAHMRLHRRQHAVIEQEK